MGIKQLETLVTIIGIFVAILLLANAVLESKVRSCEIELLELRHSLNEKDSELEDLRTQMNYYLLLDLDQLLKNRTKQAEKYYRDSQKIWEQLFHEKSVRRGLNFQSNKKRSECINSSIRSYYTSLLSLIGYTILLILLLSVYKKISKNKKFA